MKVLQDQNLTINEQLENQEFEFKTLNIKYEDLQKEVKEREESNVELIDITNEIRIENAQLEEDNEQLKDQVDTYKKLKDQTEQQLEGLRQELNSVQLKYDESVEEVKNLKKEHETTSKRLQEEITLKNSLIQKNEADIVSLNKQLSEIDLNEKDQIITELRNSNQEYFSQISERENLLNSLKNEIEELNR